MNYLITNAQEHSIPKIITPILTNQDCNILEINSNIFDTGTISILVINKATHTTKRWIIMWLRFQLNFAEIKVRQLWHLKKSKSWEPFWSYQLDSTANSAHLLRKCAKGINLTVLFS